MAIQQSSKNRRKTTEHQEEILGRINRLKEYFAQIPKRPLFEYTMVIVIVAIAATLRLLPLRWGAYLSEFDPYQQFRMAQYILEQGYSSWFTWHDNMSWYPWGRDIPTTNYPGTAFTATLTYLFLKSIGVGLTLYQWCIYFPIVFGSLTCIVAYLLGKEVWGTGAGLLAALFLAFSSSHISRTSLGFFDDETVGIFLMLIFFIFFLRATSVDKPVRLSFIYSILAGLSLAFLAASWGAFQYPAALIALYALILTLIRKGNRRLLYSYGVTYLIAFSVMMQIPKLGYAFFESWPALGIVGIFAIIAVSEIFKTIKTVSKPIITTVVLLVILISGYILLQVGLVSSLAGKFSIVLNPSLRSGIAIVESVAEHRPGTWASFFYEFGPALFLGVIGFYFAAKRGKATDIFLILFGVTTAYFASSFIRLTLIMAPAFAILSAIAIEELAKPSLNALKERETYPRRRGKAIVTVGKEYCVATLLILTIASIPVFYYATQSAYAPTILAVSSLPIAPKGEEASNYQDWLQTLVWMKDNLPNDAVVMSWWDYGYWITNIADKKSLADNGTINSTQIATIACMFLSNETWAIPIMKRYDVSHVAVFVTFTRDQSGAIRYLGFGEDNKWYWMARIGNGTTIGDSTYNFYQKQSGENVNFYRTISSNNQLIANDTIAENMQISDYSILGKMIRMGISPEQGASSPYFEPQYRSSNGFVLLYKVLYLKQASLICEVNPSTSIYGEAVTVRGKLSSPEGEPLSEKEITIESQRENIAEWEEIEIISTDNDGNYRAAWTPPRGNYSVRARWRGEPYMYVESISSIEKLTIEKADTTITCSLSNSTILEDEEVQANVQLGVRSNQGNISIQYKHEGEDWITAKIGLLTNGTFTTSWSPPTSGQYQIRAKWTGDFNYNPITSVPTFLEVEEVKG